MIQYSDDFNRVCKTYNFNALNNIIELKFNFWSYTNNYASEDEDVLMLL